MVNLLAASYRFAPSVCPVIDNKRYFQSCAALMANELIINVTLGETRVARLDNGVVADLFIERARDAGVVGNIYKGRVCRVLPGMQAAFIELGLERTAFLH